MLRSRCAALLLAIAVLAAPRLHAQATSSQSAASPFESLRFRNIGPATMGGRIDDFAVLETNPSVFYVATATGGLWKTRTRHHLGVALQRPGRGLIGDVAIAFQRRQCRLGRHGRTTPQSGSGGGIYKSTDGGHT
jgi:hypothetical protein